MEKEEKEKRKYNERRKEKKKKSKQYGEQRALMILFVAPTMIEKKVAVIIMIKIMAK